MAFLGGKGGMVLYRDFSTQEELDEQYNLRESVPDFRPTSSSIKSRAKRLASSSNASSTSRSGPRWMSASTSSPPRGRELPS